MLQRLHYYLLHMTMISEDILMAGERGKGTIQERITVPSIVESATYMYKLSATVQSSRHATRYRRAEPWSVVGSIT